MTSIEIGLERTAASYPVTPPDLISETETDETVFTATALKNLSKLPSRTERLGVLERTPPKAATAFFQSLVEHPLRLSGQVSRLSAQANISHILKESLSAESFSHPFCEEWIADMAAICVTVCDMLNADKVDLHLDSSRSCRRYHVDNVSFRTVVSYFGAGTEYLLEKGADRDAYLNRGSNDQILKDPSAIRHLNCWDIAVFRGNPGSLLHKTPDSALGQDCVFMRVDPHRPIEGDKPEIFESVL